MFSPQTIHPFIYKPYQLLPLTNPTMILEPPSSKIELTSGRCLIMACHDYIDSGKTKHTWVFGTEVIDFFKNGNQSRIDRRLEIILFPHKADNATDVKLNSAV
jgi:hypothetical protein